MKKVIYILFLSTLISCWHRPEQPPETPEMQYAMTDGLSGYEKDPNADKVGVWISGQNATAFKINVARQLGTNVVRHVIHLPVFAGMDKIYNQYTDSGLLVALTVSNRRWFTDPPQPFRKDTATFRKELESLLRALPVPPLYVALDNEENNLTYFVGPRLDYIPLLKIAVEVCHKHGIACTNGGFASFGARFYSSQKRDGRALTLQARRIDTLMQAYRSIPIDWLNVHIYSKNFEQADMAGLDFMQYVIESGGRPIMTNETGIHVNNSELAQRHLDAILGVVEHAVWFSGTRTQDVAVHDAEGNLTGVGLVLQGY